MNNINKEEAAGIITRILMACRIPSNWAKRNTQEVKLTVHYKFNLQKSKYKGTGAGLGEQQRL